MCSCVVLTSADLLVQAHLHGVLPVYKACITSLQQNASRWSNRLRQAFAVCHSLNMVTKVAVAGVDMERTLFKAVEARFLVSSSSQHFCPSRLRLQHVHCSACTHTHTCTHARTHVHMPMPMPMPMPMHACTHLSACTSARMHSDITLFTLKLFPNSRKVFSLQTPLTNPDCSLKCHDKALYMLTKTSKGSILQRLVNIF